MQAGFYILNNIPMTGKARDQKFLNKIVRKQGKKSYK